MQAIYIVLKENPSRLISWLPHRQTRVEVDKGRRELERFDLRPGLCDVTDRAELDDRAL